VRIHRKEKLKCWGNVVGGGCCYGDQMNGAASECIKSHAHNQKTKDCLPKMHEIPFVCLGVSARKIQWFTSHCVCGGKFM